MLLEAESDVDSTRTVAIIGLAFGAVALVVGVVALVTGSKGSVLPSS